MSHNIILNTINCYNSVYDNSIMHDALTYLQTSGSKQEIPGSRNKLIAEYNYESLQ